jgi:hypothetical protein
LAAENAAPRTTSARVVGDAAGQEELTAPSDPAVGSSAAAKGKAAPLDEDEAEALRLQRLKEKADLLDRPPQVEASAEKRE